MQPRKELLLAHVSLARRPSYDARRTASGPNFAGVCVMSIDEFANTRCVVCEHCGSELRVWYTPNPQARPQREVGCPACRKGISLAIRAKIESVEVMPRE